MIKLTQDTRPDDVVDFEKPETLGDVRAWSYSALKVYEDCPYRTYISRVKGVKEPSGPAADRGTQIHQEAEDYVNGTLGEMPDSCKKFEDQFEELRSLYIDAKVELEGEWGFDLDWAPVGWMQKDTWARIKLDALVQEDDTSARVIDYMVFAPGFHRRAIKMTTETEFAPTPSKDSCRWCSFRKGDEPECTWGVG